MLPRTLTAIVVVTAAVAGCGNDESSSSNAATRADSATKAETDGAKQPDRAIAAKAKGAVVKVVPSEYGRVIADRKGEALYLFDKESGPKSECYGACAVAWPPALTKGKPRAGKGVRAAKLGTTRRRDGRLQLTYAGHPLYYYKDDSPGTILCHDVVEFGGTWLVVDPTGAAAG